MNWIRMMNMTLVCLLVSLSASAGLRLDGIDTFGSTRLTAEEAEKTYGIEITEWASRIAEQRPVSFELKRQLEQSIQERFGFAYVSLSLITYFAPKQGSYVTVDVVEPNDVSRRRAFLPEPTGHFEDPDGLIALWEEYFLTGVELQRSGNYMYGNSCPVWHCTYGFEHPRLAPYLEKFNQLVPRNQEKLQQIMKEDSRENHRGNAAFLLAHIQNGSALAQAVLGSVADPSDLVRNNAVRVLSYLSTDHPEIEIPLSPILQVLNFPETTDRNKAAFVLLGLASKETHRQKIIDEAGEILLRMLRLRQPNNHDPAFEVLKRISGQNFGERDYEAWEKWLRDNRR